MRDPLKSFLTVAFPNSGFTQPAFEKQPERRADYANRVLRGYRPGTPVTDDLCVFTGEPATGVAFSDKLPPGRAFRQHVPLIMGEGIINYFPGGLAGLPVSGKALLAIQAFPLGCAKAGGRLLAVHSDSPEIIYYFASHFLQDNQREMGLAQNSGSKKLPESRSSPKTMLVQLLRDLEMKRSDEAGPGRPASVTAYHLSNSGQSNPLDRRNPPLEIYHLPLELMAFLRSIASQEYRNQWNAISARSWRLSIPKKKKDGGEPQENYAWGCVAGRI